MCHCVPFEFGPIRNPISATTRESVVGEFKGAQHGLSPQRWEFPAPCKQLLLLCLFCLTLTLEFEVLVLCNFNKKTVNSVPTGYLVGEWSSR